MKNYVFSRVGGDVPGAGLMRLYVHDETASAPTLLLSDLDLGAGDPSAPGSEEERAAKAVLTDCFGNDNRWSEIRDTFFTSIDAGQGGVITEARLNRYFTAFP